MSLLDKLLKKKLKEMSADDFGALVDELEAEQKHINADTDGLIAEMNELSPEEVAWAEWFSQLPETDKQYVEMFAKKGIKVDENNLDQVFEFVKGQNQSVERAQNEVRNSQKLLRTIIDHSVNGIIRFRWGEDEDGTKVLQSIFANAAAGQFLGTNADDLIDRVAPELIRLATSGMDSEAADDIVRRFEMAVSRGDTLDIEVHQRIGVEDRWLRMICEPMGDDFAATFVDITESKVHEELKNQELRELRDRVREIESKQ